MSVQYTLRRPPTPPGGKTPTVETHGADAHYPYLTITVSRRARPSSKDLNIGQSVGGKGPGRLSVAAFHPSPFGAVTHRSGSVSTGYLARLARWEQGTSNPASDLLMLQHKCRRRRTPCRSSSASRVRVARASRPGHHATFSRELNDHLGDALGDCLSGESMQQEKINRVRAAYRNILLPSPLHEAFQGPVVSGSSSQKPRRRRP
jgi:hypothetical protein